MDISAKCGWTIGFQRSGHCSQPAEDGSPLCGSHQAAEEKIQARVDQIVAEARRALELHAGPGRRPMRRISNSRALAETWWISTGVRSIPADVYREVLFSGPCAYCGDTRPHHVDHIVPVVQGGLSVRENLAPACRTCNQEKSDQTPEQWRRWRAERQLSWPPKPLFAQFIEAVEVLMGGDPPSFLADLVYEEIADGEVRPGGYAQDPRWQAAQVAFGEGRGDLDGERRAFRGIAAVRLMHKVEIEYEPEEQSR